MRYTKPAILSTTPASQTIQMTQQHKDGPALDNVISSASGYEADE